MSDILIELSNELIEQNPELSFDEAQDIVIENFKNLEL